MWKTLPIGDQIYFMDCFMASNASITCILYNLNECWCQTVRLSELQDKIKVLNRRLQYNDYVKNILLSGDVEDAVLEELPHATHARVLKLKYCIGGCPLRYEWLVIKQSCKEFQQNFITPLLFTLDYLGQKVEVLKGILKSKDEQLQQCYREGFTLQRKTLYTKPFNFDEFEDNFPVSRIRKNLYDLAKMVVTANTNYNMAKNSKTKAGLVSHQSHQKPKSLKKRKRIIEQIKFGKKDCIVNKKKVLHYESQSSQITTENSQDSPGFFKDASGTGNLTYNAINESVEHKLHNTTDANECKMVNSNQITDDHVKDEMSMKSVNLQSSYEMQSNESNINAITLKKEIALKELTVVQRMPDLLNISCRLRIIKQELKELENLHVVN